MNISMIPNNDVKTIHASQGDTERVWHFVPYADGVINTSQDEFASINSIRGNTLVWNQLNSPIGVTVLGVTVSVSNGKYTVSGTATGNGGRTSPISETFNVTSGHKYLLLTDLTNIDGIYVTGQTTSNLMRFNGSSFAVATYTQLSYLGLNLTSGRTYNQSGYINLFDLTQMFGAGNEPTSVSDFTSLFSLSYYPYDSGSLLSFNGTGIKTVGKNLFKTNDSLSWTPSLTKNEDGSIYVQGSRTSNGAYAIGTITLLANKTYTLKKTGSSDFYFQLVYEGGTLITGGLTDGTYTPTQNLDCTVRVFARGNINYDFTVYPQIEFGSTSSDYETYTENTTTLPIQTYFPTGMKSAGTVYDELTPTKAITRIGAVDLGTLNWTYRTDTSMPIFQAADAIRAKPLPNADTIANAICSGYVTTTSNNVSQSGHNKSIAVNVLGRNIYVQDSAYTDATTFKNSLSGVYLYYELATPSEQDISEDLTYPVYVGGTEELLPVNGTSPSTTPLDANIQYPDEARDVYFTYKQSEFESMAITGSMVCKGLEIEGETDENGITIQSTSELTSEAGFFDCKLKLTQGDGVCYSSKFQLHVEKRP